MSSLNNYIFASKSNLKISIIFLLLTSTQYTVEAQVIINPKTKTKLSTQNNVISISGGREKGKFLLHSFKRFNLNPNNSVLFLNPKSKETIVAHVKGGRTSLISGSLGTQGNTNLIFINPNGIKFGKGASLDLRGSFLASTADTLEINNDKLFLSYKNNQSSISVEGSGHNVIFPGDARLSYFFDGPQPQGLEVFPNNSLSFVGGKISYSGGVTLSPSGNTNLFSIKSGDAVVSHSNKGIDIQTKINSLGDINLKDRAFINTSGFSQGSVYINADKLKISDASLIYSESLGSQDLGEIKIDASDIIIDGITASTPLFPFTFNSYARGIVSLSNIGSGPDIDIKGNSLTLLNQGVINTNTDGKAKGANINIKIKDNVLMDGTTPFNPFLPVGSGIQTSSRNNGNSGNIQVTSKDLSLTEGSYIISIALGSGNGGNININVNNQTKLRGYTPLSKIASLISTISVGNESKQNSGNGGKLNINTKNLFLEEGGRIDASTLADGNSGSIEIIADEIVIQGKIPNDESSQIIASSDNINQFLRSIFELEEPTGNSGSITIKANSLSISDSGSVNVRSDGSSDAGIINIEAGRTKLENNGSIGASTNGGDGGEINLSSDLLLLNQGVISSSSRGNGLGGNVNITSLFLGTKNNSKILANAENSKAGNINVFANTSVIKKNTDISASSQLGPQFDGNIDLNIQNQQIQAQQKIAPTLKPAIFVADVCKSGNNSITKAPRNLHEDFITDPELIEAADLKKRQEAAEHFKFRDSSGKIHTFRRWLGVEKLERNKARFIYSPNQSKKLQNMISSLESKCKSFSS